MGQTYSSLFTTEADFKESLVPSSSYDPDQIPPSFRRAFIHYKAQRIGTPYPDSDEKCQCCEEFVNRRPMKMSDSYVKFSYLGSGYPLFFHFLKYCVFMLLIMLITSGIIQMVNNSTGSKCLSAEEYLVAKAKSNDSCNKTLVTQLSYLNRSPKPPLLRLEEVLQIVAILAMMVFLQQYRYQQKRLVVQCDEEDQTVQDFTIMVKNIPRGLKIDYQKELKQYFEENSLLKQKTPIVNVFLIYDYTEFEKLLQNQNELFLEKQELVGEILERYENNQDTTDQDQRLQYLKTKIENVKKKLTELGQSYQQQQNGKFLGQALVVFQKSVHKDCVLKQSRYHSFLTHFFSNEKVERRDLKFFGKTLHIYDSKMPSMILWYNCKYSYKNRLVRRIFSYFLHCALIFLGFVFVTYCIFTQDHYKYVGDITDFVFPFLIGLTIQFINYGLKWLMITMAYFEKHQSQGMFQESCIVTLGLLQFFNTALTIYVIGSFLEKNLTNMVQNQTVNLILNAIIPTIFNFLDFGWLYQRYCQRTQKLKGKRCTLTQQELNNLFKDPEFDFISAYSNIIKTMFFTSLFQSYIPLGTLINVVGISIQFYSYKWKLIRLCSSGVAMDHSLNHSINQIMDANIFLYAVSILRMKIYEGQNIELFSIITAITFIIIFMPNDTFNKRIFGDELQVNQNIDYYEVEHQFQEFYEHFNPVTAFEEIFRNAKDD